MKQYLKRVLSTFIFLNAIIVLTAVLCTLIIQFAFWFKPQIKIIVYFALVLSTAIMLYIVFLRHWESESLKANIWRRK